MAQRPAIADLVRPGRLLDCVQSEIPQPRPAPAVDTQVNATASQITLPLSEQSEPLSAAATTSEDVTDATNAIDAADAAPTAAAPESVDAAPATIDFKGISLPVMRVALSQLEPEHVAAAILTRFGKNPGRFFDNDPAVLDLGKVAESTHAADWATLKAQLAGASLQLVAVYGGSPALQDSARAAGLAVIDAPPVARSGKAKEETVATPAAATPPAEAAKPAASKAAAAVPTPTPAPVPAPAPASTMPASTTAMIVDKPLRSGQRIYARGTDLVVLAMVSAGAEVIADGNIHIYAPLRGRALAGAQGDHKARIFTTSFEAELVSIAGVYRTFESPQQFGKLGGQPVQVSLIDNPNNQNAEPTLNVAALSTR